MILKQMGWKQMRWPLLAGAAAAGITLSSYRATSQLSNCPEVGTVLGIVLAMLVATSAIHALVTSVQAELTHSGQLRAWYSTSSGRRFLVIALGALLTAATLLLEIFVWAWVYRHVGAIHGLEASLYFSGITFTTVGYGDITLVKCWRLLSVGEAVNGVLMAGWSTAQLIFIVQRVMTMTLRPHSEDL
jgi:voltage-gated potassium channel Kch